MNEFTVTLTSPQHFESSWQTLLPETIDFTAGYEVAIMDLIYIVGSWDNVRPGKNTIVAYQELPETVQAVPTDFYAHRDLFI